MTNRRSLPVLAILALFIAGGLAAGWIYTHPAIGVSIAGSETITWSLSGMGGANSAAGEDVVVDPLIVRIHVDQWPVEDFSGPEWLTPTIERRSDMTTITLRVSDTYKTRIAAHPTIGWYDTGGWIRIVMHDPLPTCTKLRDGATGNVYDYCAATPKPS